jgi:hypothetical protein
MAQGTLVDQLVQDGRQLLEQLARDGFPIAAAWWLKPFVEVEQWEPFNPPYVEREWEFYVASTVVEDEGPAVAYDSIYKALRVMQPNLPPAFSMSRITAVGAKNPATAEVFKIMRLYGGAPPIYVARCRLGNIEAKEVYIYPVPTARKPDQADFEIRVLKTPVDVRIERQSPEVAQAMEIIQASGTTPAQAGYFAWVLEGKGQQIPAGTRVKVRRLKNLLGHLDPILLVETDQGTKGYTRLSDTESDQSSPATGGEPAR